MSDIAPKFYTLELQMDADTAEAFDAAITGHDDDILLAMEKAAQERLRQDDYDVDDWDGGERRLWVAAPIGPDGKLRLQD